MPKEQKPCINGCGKLIKNQGAHNRYCPKLQSSSANVISKEKLVTSTPTASISTPDNTKSWWKRHFGRKQKHEIIEVSSPEELIQGLKPYEIPDKNPKTGVGRFTNKDKDYIQVVLVSEYLEAKTFWAEKIGINRIRYKERMFVLPRDIRGNVFFWHIDKKEPLVDTAKATNEDAESSLHESQVANIYYTLGRIASQNEMWGNIKLILLVVLFVGLLTIFALIYDNILQKDINNNAQAILNAISAMNSTIPR